MKAGIALGSNLGDRTAIFREAITKIQQLNGVQGMPRVSRFMETAPVDMAEESPSFLNAVIEVEFHGTPLELLRMIRSIEVEMGRPAIHARNVSRTLDLDLIYCDDVEMQSEELILPHPRAHLRDFVMIPLAEIRPDLRLAGWNATAAEIAERRRVV